MMQSSDMIWRCTNRSCIARLRTDSAFRTIVPSGTGLVEKIQTSLQYNDNSNEIRKRLKHSFGFHFLCPSNVEMWAEFLPPLFALVLIGSLDYGEVLGILCVKFINNLAKRERERERVRVMLGPYFCSKLNRAK